MSKKKNGNVQLDLFEALSGKVAVDRERARADIVKKVDRCIRLLNEEWGMNIEMPELRFDLKGAHAGQVITEGSDALFPVLRFNLAVAIANWPDFLETTVPHEVAHLGVYAKWGRRPRVHGREWKATMATLGVPAKRCASDSSTTP